MLGNALDNYSKEIPSLQNAIDIFHGEWSSAIPGASASGPAPLFSDPRAAYWIDKVAQHFNQSSLSRQINALELGPLEGAHTYMYAHAGWKVTSVESNSRAFLKTLIVYNEFSLNAKVLFGDFIPYLGHVDTPVYDFISASGVLYHMKDPIDALDLMCSHCLSLGLWTHFITDEFIDAWPGRWVEHHLISDEQSFTGYKQYYGTGLESHAFCGGGQDYAIWLKKDDILQRIMSHGFTINIRDIDADHPNGPCMTLFASKH
ncbi:MAG: hypothetical protein VKN13_05310 [Cyanobacteriota bacterium]|nr:hypothetical protein [Cyanobacteriota bacterium]